MVHKKPQNYSKWVFTLMILIFLFCGTVPVFSQEILASIISGIQKNPSYNDQYGIIPCMGANVLFIGKNGFTISTGIDGSPISTNVGVGYIHYNTFYFGGIFNCMNYLTYSKFYSINFDDVAALTFVAGYKFKNDIVLGGQLSYLVPAGFRFELTAGINMSSSSDNKRKTGKNSENAENNTDNEEVWW